MATSLSTSLAATCPCRVAEEHARSYGRCCAPWHAGRADASALPQSAEQLMRSRYSAFVLQLADYLLATWHESTRPRSIDFDPGVHWLGLRILSTRAGQESASRGVVEFEASYRAADGVGTQHEKSTFVKEDGAWFYLDAL
ncbi:MULTISPECIES: YchJ family metal-binding protein [Glutamicibacter]|uniref:YchJ family protein n=1 Tax=Glutamicibacter TaxID=1742989 RepID=UPI001FE6668B|nr:MULTISPECIES: YchJ family metal-binding protein [Glutamicibacter]